MEAVQGQIEVFMDGGIRSGSDVVKALCMGARSIFIGRPALWGLVHNVRESIEENAPHKILSELPAEFSSQEHAIRMKRSKSRIDIDRDQLG